MKKVAYILVLILLALAAGCDLNIFDPNDNDHPRKGWIELDAYDFPVYIGHFADYVHTDAQGNSLGTVSYGEGGNGKDWMLFEYDASKKTHAELKDFLRSPALEKDSYHVCVQAIDASNNQELPALINLDAAPTGQVSPHTFTHEGSYDPSLESRYSVELAYYEFNPNPEVSYNPETNTYIYRFRGYMWIPPPGYSFMASLTEQGHVLLRWTTLSYNNPLGFQLYRSETNDYTTATLITAELIPATDTNELLVYSHTDVNVSAGHCYYYWLEEVFEGNSSNIYGPVYILMPPAVNSVAPAYPNPCQSYFRLPLVVKFDSAATILLLDRQHAVRKTYVLGAGQYHHYVPVDDLEPGLYRVFIWFHDGQYSYGDVLIQD
ncbi:MAG: hypothetical protein U1B83_04170 [Candidatus Cloacimonadaceae bacterium]|nr:hypothetical protein [Candidatus Cloacimonadaceae bacterium]